MLSCVKPQGECESFIPTLYNGLGDVVYDLLCLVFLGCHILFSSYCHLGRSGLVKVVMGEFGTLYPYVSCGVHGENRMPTISKGRG